MTDQEVTYATVRFHKSSELQNPVRSEKTQRSREDGHREYSVPWKFIVIVLGILCSLLLVTVAVLVTYILQFREEKNKQEKTLNNLHQEYHIMKKNISSKEEMLKNKSLECDALKDSLYSLNKEENRCYQEAKIALAFSQHKGKDEEGHWFCCGKKCYYFIMSNEKWSECNQICQIATLSLLKIDDEDELKFLKSLLQGNKYWIGLTKKKQKWQWINGGPSNLDLGRMNFYKESCACLSSFQIEAHDCNRLFGCICEQRLSKFHDLVSCVTER